MDIDYEKIGLKVGLEVHQQLDTTAKLFCACKPELFKEEPEITFLRGLRPTQSELGQIDPAAFFEFQKGMRIRYEANSTTSCLVEMDEEPPHPLNTEAVDIVLTVAFMMKAAPIEEVHVMRKTVIDGSNTTGFQRTCVIALDGQMRIRQKIIPILHLSLEEDAARKTGDEEGNITRYRIDRLGIPLIEVTTGPVIKTSKEAGEVALAIGSILRATGKARRGLGTIRQDLNVSILKGALIEIKGVQELELVPLAVDNEVKRQLNLIQIAEDLRAREIPDKALTNTFQDVSEVFRNTNSKLIRKALDKNQQVLAVKLQGLAGFLKRELLPDFRLGTEMADQARFWGRVGGIFHTDEMPAYAITADEVKNLKKRMKASDGDAVVFVADNVENAQDALKAVVARTRAAFNGVPEETRVANPDGTTRFMRPRPGAARMYPETDIPAIQISDAHIAEIRNRLPMLPEQKLELLVKHHGLNDKLAKQVLDSPYSELYTTIVKETDISPVTVAAFLTETLKSLRRDGVDTEKVSDDTMLDVFRLVSSGQIVKESISNIVTWLSKNEDKTPHQAIDSLGLKGMTDDELERIVESVLAKNKELIRSRSEGSLGILMGILMKDLRGKVDAGRLSRILKEKLSKL